MGPKGLFDGSTLRNQHSEVLTKCRSDGAQNRCSLIGITLPRTTRSEG